MRLDRTGRVPVSMSHLGVGGSRQHTNPKSRAKDEESWRGQLSPHPFEASQTTFSSPHRRTGEGLPMARTQGLHPLGPFKPMCDMSQGIFCLSPSLFSSAGLRSLQFGLSDTNPLFRVNKIIASLEPQRGCDCKESCDCQPRREISEYYWLGQWAVRGPPVAFCSASLRVTAGPLLIDIFLSLETYYINITM